MSAGVSGFEGPSGAGLVTPDITIYCSEEPANPLTVAFTLVDDLGFESREESVDLTVDYSSCQ